MLNSFAAVICDDCFQQFLSDQHVIDLIDVLLKKNSIANKKSQVFSSISFFQIQTDRQAGHGFCGSKHNGVSKCLENVCGKVCTAIYIYIYSYVYIYKYVYKHIYICVKTYIQIYFYFIYTYTSVCKTKIALD